MPTKAVDVPVVHRAISIVPSKISGRMYEIWQQLVTPQYVTLLNLYDLTVP